MRVGSFLFDVEPPGIVAVLRALDRSGFLARAPAADLAQLEGLGEAALVVEMKQRPTPSLDELEASLRVLAAGGEGVLHLYAKLVAPADLPEPLRSAALEELGALDEDVDERAPVDPFEIVLPIPLDDPTGGRRARAFRGMRETHLDEARAGLVLLSEADPPTSFALGRVVELRALEEACSYLAFALARAGVLVQQRVYLATLDGE